MPDRPPAGERRPWCQALTAAAAVVALVVVAQPTTAPVGAVGRSAEVTPASTATVDVAPGVQLRIERPPAAGPVPVLVHVPGGGWRDHDETDVAAAFGQRAALADGWAVATLRYRPADPASGVTASDQADDVDAALAWLRSAGPSVGLLPRIVASGHSAGAHVLALAAARAPREHQPVALVLISGVYDFAPDVLAAPMLAPVVAAAVGCDPPTCDTVDLRPATFADPGDARVTVVHGTADVVAPVSGAERYAAAAAAAGVPVTLRLVEGDGHLGPRLAAEVRRALAAVTSSAAA